MFTRVIAISAVYSAMLDDDPVDMAEGKAAAERWASTFPQMASHMREQRMSEPDAPLSGRARLIADQGQDLARAADSAGVSPEQFGAWLSDEFLEDLERMPYVGRLGEVLYLRLRNADYRWEANDLNDMNFLCAAAGHADITIGEKKTIEYPRRAEPRYALGRRYAAGSAKPSRYWLHAASRRDTRAQHAVRVVDGQQPRGERLGPEVGREFGPGYAVGIEREDRVAMAPVEHAEPPPSRS